MRASDTPRRLGGSWPSRDTGSPGQAGRSRLWVTRPSLPQASLRGALAPKQSRGREQRLSTWPLDRVADARDDDGEGYNLQCHPRAGGIRTRRPLGGSLPSRDTGSPGQAGRSRLWVTRPSSPQASLRGALAPKQSRGREQRLSTWPLDRVADARDDEGEGYSLRCHAGADDGEKSKPRPAGGTGQGLYIWPLAGALATKCSSITIQPPE